MVTKKKVIKLTPDEEKLKSEFIEEINNNLKSKNKEFKPFIEKDHIFETVVTTKWLINFDKLREYLQKHTNSNTKIFNHFWNKYVNWLNWNFDNPCICPFMFIGEKEYPVFTKNIQYPIVENRNVFDNYINFQVYKMLRGNKLW